MRALHFSLLITLAAASGAHAQPAGWTVATPKEADAVLAHGEALVASCVRGSGQIRISARAAPDLFVWRPSEPAMPVPVSITVMSGALSTTLRGEAILNSGGYDATASTEIATRAPVIAAFRKTGDLQILAGEQALSRPPAAATRDVRSFLRACK